jgi:hypothetical protein
MGTEIGTEFLVGDVAARGPGIIVIRGELVVLDATAAAAFGVETRAVNQAVTRNLEKFPASHCFRLTQDERVALTSRNVISNPNRGGSRSPPQVFTQKGVVRLATVLRSRRALVATDQMIDLFLEVHRQLVGGQNEITVSHPSRFVDRPALRIQLQNLQTRLLAAIEGLLDTVVDPITRTTVREEVSAIGVEALDALKAHLRTRSLENEKIAADTLLILEKVREIRQRAAADVARTRAETESIHLDNLDRKIAMVQRLLQMTREMEQNAMIDVLGHMAKKAGTAGG